MHATKFAAIEYLMKSIFQFYSAFFNPIVFMFADEKDLHYD